MVTTKKAHLASGQDFVSAQDLNEECLRVGWIDSKPGRVDESRSALLCTPRKSGSSWSGVNGDRLNRLLDEGKVTPRALAIIEAAKADGSWSRLDDVDALVVADDLAATLGDRPPARACFNAFPPSSRRGILEWILNARRPETRAARVERTAELAQQDIRALQWRPTRSSREASA